MRFRHTVLIAVLASVLLAPSLFAQTKTIGVLPARLQKEIAQGRRYALLIGIGKYQDKRIPKLDYTAADAKAMYAVLTDPSHGRFAKERVKLLLDKDATATQIRRAFTWLRRRARPQDMVIVYYSGHGAPEEGSTYWVPHDADIDDLEATSVSNAYITRQLGRIRSKRLITFLDSCYSSAIVEKQDKSKALFDQDFFKRFQGTGRVTLTASDGKELSLESQELGQGVFTHYLVQALKGKADTNSDGAVELEEVWAHVRRRVTDEAQRRGNRQRPKLIGNLSAGLLVSLNPGILPKFHERQRTLAKLLQAGRISGMEYEEAKKVLDGEGDMRFLAFVRDLADGNLAPRYYRSAKAEVLRGKKRLAPPPSDNRTASLLKKADTQIGLNRLTSPKDNNAYNTLQEILRIAPGNPGALRRLREIAEKYKAWGRTRIGAGDWKRAEHFLLSARKVFGEDPELDDLLDNVRSRLGLPRERPGESPVPEKREPKTSASVGTGDLFIVSEPPGAAVFMDGSRPSGLTPLLAEKVPAGEHRILFRKGETHGGFRDIRLKAGELKNLTVSLERLKGELYVKVRPFGSEVLVDGKRLGKSPLKTKVNTGERQVEVRQEGYRRYSGRVKVEFGKTTEVSQTLAAIPTGTLVVSSTPSGAEIFIGKRSVGKTPRAIRLYEGEYTVRFRKPGYKPSSQKALVRGDRKSTVVAVLAVVPIPGGMVKVPAGWFIMGSENDDNEKPRRRVYLDKFFIDKFPVPYARFRRFERPKDDYGSKFNGDHQPVVGVTWFQARDYCKSVGKRLPTEAEWEKAARGVDGRKYPWGDQWDDSKVIRDKNSGNKTHPVDRTYNTHRSPYGAVDMVGNVWGTGTRRNITRPPRNATRRVRPLAPSAWSVAARGTTTELRSSARRAGSGGFRGTRSSTWVFVAPRLLDYPLPIPTNNLPRHSRSSKWEKT